MCRWQRMLAAMPAFTLEQAFQVALARHQAGQLREAESLYRQILAQQPEHGDSLHMLGVLTHQAGEHGAAAQLIRKAIELLPGHAGCHTNLGTVLRAQGQLDEAIAAYRAALMLQPKAAVAHFNLGVALHDAGRIDEAIACYRRALALEPDSTAARTNLGNALKASGRLEEALGEYRQAVALEPRSATTHYNLGVAFEDARRLDDAIESYQRALTLDPSSLPALNNLGHALQDAGRLEEAVAAFRRAIELQPTRAETHNNLGTALKDQGRIEEAIAAFRAALRLDPDAIRAQSNLLLDLHYLAHAEPEAIFREHREWNRFHAEPLAKSCAPHPNDPSPDRRLRIGYVSPDFRSHSVAFFLEALLASHDRDAFEIVCYADLRRPDETTARMREHADHWREIAALSDVQVAELVRADRIDILVDLAGHTARHRLLVFARKAAPVQVSYLGYCDTTGLSAMDYRLTDAFADPPGMTEHLHSEQLIRLAPSAWCFRPAVDAPAVSRAAGGDVITFGSFNTLAKMNDEMLALWSQILTAVPMSRLVLKNLGLQDRTVQQRLRAIFAKSGIALDRVELLGRTRSMAEHLRCYERLDVALDTFPYHGTTTTCEALWMGVPVVTLAGATHASRVGVSLLENLGRREWIAHSPEDYVRIATELASDPRRLTKLRAGLREEMARSPLMDGAALARSVESAFRQMWRTWCARHNSLATP
jgi:predicted O-linked N-acetylglucosamine transferase (SPINDLY family)